MTRFDLHFRKKGKSAWEEYKDNKLYRTKLAIRWESLKEAREGIKEREFENDPESAYDEYVFEMDESDYRTNTLFD